MQAFNGLVADDLGHRFTEGQLDNDFEIRIERNRLTMSNALALATVDAEEIPGKEGPPLATAVALLEDRDGNIKLDVPVEGDLTDPNFRVLGALNPIIMKAVAGTAALAIQPLGSVLLVGSLLADQALKVTFQPAPFDAGSTELNPAARQYLDQLATKLRDKPKLRVRVCGVVVDAERKKDKQGRYADSPEALLAVAQRRADAVKAYMRDKVATDKQLRRCRPAFDPQADAKPRVDIKF
jgi:outer membrane protein OmpA-like peptidoglycan-associated protein